MERLLIPLNVAMALGSQKSRPIWPLTKQKQTAARSKTCGRRRAWKYGIAFRGFQVGGLLSQRGHDCFAFRGRQPCGLAGVVLHGDEPDDQPQKRE